MALAFVMVTAAPGESQSVYEAVAGLDGVRDAHVVAGAYDVVLEVEAAEVSGLLEVVASRVGSLDSVLDTRTYVSLE